MSATGAQKVKNPDYNDFFVAGLTGSGKDTVSDYLKGYYGMRKMRIAGTIKQIICEDLNMTFDELEESKRTNPDIRMKHHEVSAMLGNQKGSLVRTEQIAKHQSFDLNIVDDPERPIVVCDVRTMEEAEILLQNGWIGIFLERTTSEFRHESHFTENNMFQNGNIVELAEVYGDNMLVVFNASDIKPEKRFSMKKQLGPVVNIVELDENPNADALLEGIESQLHNWLDNK